MTTFDAAAGRNDLNRLGHDHRESPDRQPTLGHTAGGPVSKRIITGYGFWIFLLSDIIMFSAFFAAYASIEMPRNSPTGFICAFFATIMGFALVWHIWWMVGLAALGAYATFVVFAWRDFDEYIIPAETVARIDRANRSARSAALARREVAP